MPRPDERPLDTRWWLDYTLAVSAEVMKLLDLETDPSCSIPGERGGSWMDLVAVGHDALGRICCSSQGVAHRTWHREISATTYVLGMVHTY